MTETLLTHSEISLSENRLSGLDGLRAIAVVTTIYHHLIERYVIKFHNPILSAFDWSGDGVGIFFVLSGFLITTLMLREHAKDGSVSLTEFYLRRFFRICPPLYAYLIFFAVFCVFEGTHIDWTSLLSSALFYIDYPTHTPFWAYQHTWSLSVEEQFYILWPIILLTALRLGGRPAAAKVAIVLIAVTPALRILTKFSHSPVFYHRQHLMLHTRMDSLMCGCLVALVVGQPAFERLYRLAAKYWWLAPLYIFFLDGALHLALGFTYSNSIGFTVDSICMAFFILWCTRNPDTIMGKILNNPVIIKIGVLSYSIYIWQTFFIYYDVYAHIPLFLCSVPVRLALILLAALLSHVLVEQPSLKLRQLIVRRRRMANVTTAATKARAA